jgi:hypothetical protein
MAYEKRQLRPFDSMDDTQRLLNQKLRVQSPPIPEGFQPNLGALGVSLVGVTSGSIAAPGGTLVLDRQEYMSKAIGLYFGVHDDDWNEITRAVRDDLDKIFGRNSSPPVNLVVTLSNSRLRFVEKVIDIPYGEWMSQSWRSRIAPAYADKRRPRPLRMPDDGCTITVQFLLAQDLPEKQRMSGRPWRKGSWLTRHEIKVSSARGSGLAPRPLTDAHRKRLQLGPLTTSFVDFRTYPCHGICTATDLSDFLSVYIDEQLLLETLELDATGDHKRPGSGPLLTRLVLDVLRALVMAYSHDDELDDFDPTLEDHQRTYLYSLLSQINDANLASIEEALQILRDAPMRFIALLEHTLATATSDRRLLQLKG